MREAGVAIGDLVEADLSSAIAIDLEAFTPGELGVGQEDPHVVRDRSLREEMARAWARLRVAKESDGRVVGYSLYWHVVDEIHLLNVAVTIGARRRGIGRALVNELLDYARANGAVRVLLEVRASNGPAIAMYEALGFARFNVRAKYYADGEDAVEMSIAL